MDVLLLYIFTALRIACKSLRASIGLTLVSQELSYRKQIARQLHKH